jgi:hypothetical protein
MSEGVDDRAREWPLRPWIMAAVGAAAGLIFHFLSKHEYGDSLAIWRQAGATFVAISALSFLITTERLRFVWTLGFAIAWGVVIALVGWFTAGYNRDATIFEWPYFSGIFAVMIAAPLFQTIRDEGRGNFPYGRLHNHAWTDAVIGVASLAFTGVVFLLAWLIAGLFDLIGIEAIRKLLQKEWFTWVLSGFAFGAAVGILRERERLLATLRRLVMIVYSVLAPVLAVALVLFLASIPFTGLGKLWKSGVPATPLLLLAGAGAILLANAVFGDGKDDRSDNRLLNWSALLLVAVILPLSIIAAYSMGIRISQYGWTPERIWGVIAVAVAIAYGIAGWYTIWRGRLEFDEHLRPLQTSLAIGLCGLALFLALPILDFGAMSARSQIARLESGKVSPAKFDWKAMAFDFGPAGRSRLQQIAKSASPGTNRLAATALAAKDRWDATQEKIVAGPLPVEVTVYPAGSAVPAELRALLLHGRKGEQPFCSEGGACRVYAQSDGATFVAFMDGCANLAPAERIDPKIRCNRSPGVFEKKGGKWVNVYGGSYMGFSPPMAEVSNKDEIASLKRESEALDRGDVRIVTVEKRQLQIGGKPAGDVF